MKLINGAVITKCFECPHNDSINEKKVKCCLTDNRSVKHLYNPNTIDPSCPLASCEVIDILEGKDKIVRIEYGYNGCAFEANKISHIIIVKKPTTADKVEKGENK